MTAHRIGVHVVFFLSLFAFYFGWRWKGRYRQFLLEISSITGVSAFFLLFRKATWKWSLSFQQFVALIIFGLLFWLMSRPWFRKRYVGEASATQMAWVRIVVCASLLVLVVKDDIVTTVHVPLEFMIQEGPLRFLFSWFPAIFDMRSPVFLGCVRWTAIVSLTCGIVGILTRPMLFIGAFAFTLFYYVEISYTHFFHSGWIPLQILYLLCFLPCTDAFTLRRFGKPALVANERYGQAFFICIVVYGVCYYACGLSKWFTDPFWATGNNLLKIFAQDAPGLIDHTFGLNLIPEYIRAGYPQWFFTPLAYAGLFIETAGILLLFFRGSRAWVALAILGLHLGIFLGQKFLFADLAVLPFMLLNIDWARQKWLGLPMPTVTRGIPASLASIAAAPFMATLIWAGWCFGWERYPVTSQWGMYAVSGHVEKIIYQLIHAVPQSGNRFVTDLTDQLTWAGMAKWQDVTPFPRDRKPSQMDKLNKILQNYASLYNKGKPPEQQIVRFEFELSLWDFVQDPKSPTYGEVIDKIVIPVEK